MLRDLRGVRVAAMYACALLLVLCPGVQGQEEEGQVEDSMGVPAISARSVSQYGDLLGLTVEQREIVKVLHADYLAAAREEQRKVQEIWEKMQGMWEGMEHLTPEEMNARQAEAMALQEQAMEASRAQFKRMQELQDGLFGDMRQILTAEQEAVWPRVERMRRREMILRELPFTWSAADLVDVLMGMKIGQEGEAADLAVKYEVEVDRVLEPMWAMATEIQDEMAEMTEPDEERIMEIMQKFFDWSKELRRLNKEYARRLELVIPEGEREAFRREVMVRSFPEVYGKSETMKAIEVARGFADLDEAQRESIRVLSDQYERELAGANERWATALDKRDDEATAESMMMWGWEEEGPVAEAKQARGELDASYRERLERVLTEAQRARLPGNEPEAAPLEVPAGGGGG